MFTAFPWVYVVLSCLKQLPLNLTLVLVHKCFTEALRKLWGAEGDLILSSDTPLDFHSKI